MMGIRHNGYIDYTSAQIWQNAEYEYARMFFPVSMPAGMIYLKGFPFGRKNNSGLLSENEKVRVCF